MQEEDGTYPVSFCPSFSCYSSAKLAEIAIKVSSEVPEEEEELEAASRTEHTQLAQGELNGESDEKEDEFEFVNIIRTADSDGVSLRGNGEYLYNGQIGDVFPVFNRDLLLNRNDDLFLDRKQEYHQLDQDDLPATVAIPLRNLFLIDRDDHPSPSATSSEADELEGVPEGTYCVWAPQTRSPSPISCNKSKSTGSSSKRWRLRDLLKRSHSDGKDSFLFLRQNSISTKTKEEHNHNHINSHNHNHNQLEKQSSKESKGKNSSQSATTADHHNHDRQVVKMKVKKNSLISAHEAFYVRNKAMKEDDKRKSYLPYRQDLVGFFANVNSSSKNFPPFYS